MHSLEFDIAALNDRSYLFDCASLVFVLLIGCYRIYYCVSTLIVLVNLTLSPDMRVSIALIVNHERISCFPFGAWDLTIVRGGQAIAITTNAHRFYNSLSSDKGYICHALNQFYQLGLA